MRARVAFSTSVMILPSRKTVTVPVDWLIVIAMQSELDIDLDVTDMNAETFETIQAITALVEARRGSAPGADD